MQPSGVQSHFLSGSILGTEKSFSLLELGPPDGVRYFIEWYKFMVFRLIDGVWYVPYTVTFAGVLLCNVSQPS